MPRVNVAELLGQIEIDQVARKLGMQLREDSATRKMAICPFHNDKTPSLLIDTSREADLQHFHCFACGSHGTAIDLARERLNTDFNGAIEWLEAAFGIRARGERAHTAEVKLSGLDDGYGIYRSSSQHEKMREWSRARKFDPEFLRRAGFVYAKSGTLVNSDRVKNMSRDSRIEMMGILEDAGLV